MAAGCSAPTTTTTSSSGSDVAYLGLMLLLVTIGCVAVWVKERRPVRADSVAEFRRGLDALAPRDEQRG